MSILSPPPPAPAPPSITLPSDEAVQPLPAAVPPPSTLSLSPSLLIIAAIILFVFFASVSIHFLLRFISRFSSSSSSRVVSMPSPSSSPSASSDLFSPTPAAAAAEAEVSVSEKEKADALIEALPLFTLASSLAALPKSSPDCAVCLSPFDPSSDLRLLPACRHAFHAQCIDTWLRGTPSCPLCRASVRLPFPPLSVSASSGGQRSGSFRVEIGSISRRRTSSSAAGDENLLANARSYSLGSFDYLVEEEIEAVVSRITRLKEEKAPEFLAGIAGAPAPPGEELAELAGGGEGRGWLRDYVDRLASSASSSFNSLRFSGRWSARWSHRNDGGVSGDSRRWDVEAPPSPPPPPASEEATFYAVYRWIVGI